MKLLSLSNGHGEDAIALRILQQLQHQAAAGNLSIELAALPIVGRGKAYEREGIPIIGTVQEMPSGGFIYMDGRQFIRDLQGGLLPLTWSQLQTVKAWAQAGGVILAVGDIVPLLFAWWSGAPYAFVGTARSEYYLRNDQGTPLPHLSYSDQLSIALGSVYSPLDRWLMGQPRCKAVFPRDPLTSEILQQQAIPAFNLGNPMMDGLEPTLGAKPSSPSISQLASQSTNEMPHACLLLPGSRAPEAHENWRLILRSIAGLVEPSNEIINDETFDNKPLTFLAAIAPNLDIYPFCQILETQGWRSHLHEDLTFSQGSARLCLTTSAFNDYLHLATVAIAMAGTATEQVVGLGKPVITLPGKGPQFTPAFAEAQTRLLGASIILVQQPEQVAAMVRALFQDAARLQQIAENGYKRMGRPGAAERIAQRILAELGSVKYFP